MKKTIVAALIIMAGLLLHTALPASATVLRPHTLNTLEFSYVESIFAPDGTIKKGVDLMPGDHLIGIISVNRIIAQGETVFTTGPGSQLTGIFAHKVLSVPPYFLEGGFALDPFNPAAPFAHVEFGSPDMGRFTDGFSTISLAEILAPGEMLALWLDQGGDTGSYTTEGTLAHGVERATAGRPYFSAGIGSSGYFYSHVDPGITPEELMQGALIGQALGGLEVMTNTTGNVFGFIGNPDDQEKMVATELPLSINLFINPDAYLPPWSSPWTLAGYGSAQIHPAPEPSTFALFAVAGGVWVLCRVKKRR